MTRILAAFVFFTRLPFWRLAEIPAHYFRNVVVFWPLTGWVTAGVMVAVLYGSSLLFPVHLSLLVAMISRLLLTGCLHEDGLADFFDGFGGGREREQVLSIMKDSHTGSYGVIGLIFYFALFYFSLSGLPVEVIGGAILAGDPFSKGITAQMINLLPYARKENQSKNKTIYSRMKTGKKIMCAAFALVPLGWLAGFEYLWATVLPVLLFLWLILFIKQRIQGYTGDCCGAVFLLCEVSFYMGIAAVYYLK